MKVIHFIAGIDKGGGGTTEYMRLLSTALKKHMEIVVATKKTSNPIDIEGVRVKFFQTSTLRWFSMLKEFREFLLEEKPDIVHINGIWSPQNWGFQKIAQELGIKVIISPHGMLEPWILSRNYWKKRLGMFFYQNKAIQKAEFLHTTAEMEALNIQYLGYKTPIHIIPNGIDLNDIKGIKENYGTKKIVFLSRIHPKKGIELLLEAWRNCNTNGWNLEIAGNGNDCYIAGLSKSAQDLKNVNFVGAKYGKEKWDFLRSADVMILPTHSENFGIVIAEALALGVPVITTQGTPWEDLEIHECGWWISLSVSNLEKIISEVIQTSAAELETMGRNGRKLVAEKYEIRAVANEMNDLYKKILN
ncbi:glycosyltransferase [Flavobacterium defluvii]|uniref:Glycosyltransferase involved in cell wall bisynthesis n=1 Tax=Flavobacterium defluvii TaxID=370979 RepID=A0A1M5PQ10_9FLAO|nr:glycosyltransferase [Flavobacterium defluvii]SHH03771.1 Glycosyltransferase involved in cell wall bisynthesis [Flavobacterium defluvii]